MSEWGFFLLNLQVGSCLIFGLVRFLGLVSFNFSVRFSNVWKIRVFMYQKQKFVQWLIWDLEICMIDKFGIINVYDS